MPRVGRAVQGNQYAVTEYYTPVHKGDASMPAVWFVYDISPISVSIARARRSLAHLAVRSCAVVGGVFAVTGARAGRLIGPHSWLLSVSESLLAHSVLDSRRSADTLAAWRRNDRPLGAPACAAAVGPASLSVRWPAVHA